MKIVIMLMTLLTASIALAESDWSAPSVNCDSIDLSTRGQSSFNLYISKDGTMNSESPLVTTFNEFNAETKEQIENSDATFDVKILKKVFFDKVTKTHWGMRPVTIQTKTYAVRVNVSSNKVIGHRINGCIPQPVKELEKEIFCHESISTLAYRSAKNS